MFDFLLMWITVNPSPIMFRIPLIDHPIAWYGAIFATAFYVGYKLFIWMYKRHLLNSVIIPKEYKNIYVPQDFKLTSKQQALFDFYAERGKETDTLKKYFYIETKHPDKLESIDKKAVKFSESALVYILLATVIGARLAHIIFYRDIMEFVTNPIEIIKTWEGGLASHGGVAAILLASYLVVRKHKNLTFFGFMDLLCIPGIFVCAWIRIGNFINQEILGSQTSMPWGIIFKHPADGGAIVPRHPIQLYEFVLYMTVFALLFALWNKRTYKKTPGLYIGLCMAISFSVRFFLEFLKVPQSVYDNGGFLQVGQYLSLPMVLVGLACIYFAINRKVDLDKKLSEF